MGNPAWSDTTTASSVAPHGMQTPTKWNSFDRGDLRPIGPAGSSMQDRMNRPEPITLVPVLVKPGISTG
jgi:hypothetical protein